MRVIKDCNRRRQWTSNRHLSIREIGFRRWLQRECKCNKGSQRFFLCSFSFPRHLPILFSCHLVNKDDSWHVYILGYYHHSHFRIRGSKVYKKVLEILGALGFNCNCRKNKNWSLKSHHKHYVTLKIQSWFSVLSSFTYDLANWEAGQTLECHYWGGEDHDLSSGSLNSMEQNGNFKVILEEELALLYRLPIYTSFLCRFMHHEFAFCKRAKLLLLQVWIYGPNFLTNNS